MSHVHGRYVARDQIGVTRYSCAMSDAIAGQSFADLIAGGRTAKRWSQEDLERESGVSRSTLSRWERGQAGRPEPAHVRAVCRVLGIDPRRAAVALGYLTADEVDGSDRPLTLRPDVEEVLRMLEDPALPQDDRAKWIEYLKYLYQRAQNQAG